MALTLSVLLDNTASNSFTTASGLLYTVPASSTAVVKSIEMSNITDNNVNFSLYYVPSGVASPSSSYAIGGNVIALPAHSYYQIKADTVLTTGYKIYGYASSNSSIYVHISGVIVT